MPKMNRRTFLASAAAAGAATRLPNIAVQAAKTPPMRRVLTLVYDKSLGMMRAVERLIP
ncbi:twin-arginine translocation signal domain-containing protein [Aliiroseovarius sp. M344]|uniref:twin-arginine translocation signal domain-containing protein n=1 Tax=Aliiroseovarius sp. M344 TaxID=2867010 RepID=UPI0021ADED89|nr:twin-arginine translocation signal domain-containing protein [Aliiroseovarius sp. M344]UWQ15239.1 twin-arginine translocation signal domain-containing protein [Aliiroseovarius sp. M344]